MQGRFFYRFSWDRISDQDSLAIPMARPQQSHCLALWSTHPRGLDGTANTNLSTDLRHGSQSNLPCLVLFGCFVIYNHRLPCHLWNQYKPDRFINIFVLERWWTSALVETSIQGDLSSDVGCSTWAYQTYETLAFPCGFLQLAWSRLVCT